MGITTRKALHETSCVLEPLTREAFAPFGFVIETGEHPIPANGGTAQRHDAGYLATDARADTGLCMSLFDCEPQSFPLRLQWLERHPHSPQTIAPLNGQNYVVVVCPDAGDGLPDTARLRAFRAGGDQGVNYHPGIWHHGIIALTARSLFFVQSWQNGSAQDCEILPIDDVTVLAPDLGDFR